MSRTASIMMSLFQIIFRNSFQESVGFSWIFWDFYKVNCGVNVGFSDTSLSERCLNCWLVKEIMTFWVLLTTSKSYHGRISFFFQILFSFVLEKKKNLSPIFWSDGIFGLGRFSIDWVAGLLKSLFFDKRPLNVRSSCRECLLFKRLHGMA